MLMYSLCISKDSGNIAQTIDHLYIVVLCISYLLTCKIAIDCIIPLNNDDTLQYNNILK